MSTLSIEQFQAKVEDIFEHDRPGPFAVVRVYGINLGMVSPEIEEYMRKFEVEYPDFTLDWFGPKGDQEAVAYWRPSFTEMFDGGAGNKHTMICPLGPIKDIWGVDNHLCDYVEALGFFSYTFSDCDWFVLVTTFG